MSSASASCLEVLEHKAGHGLSQGHFLSSSFIQENFFKRSGPLFVRCISTRSFKMTLAKDLGGEGHPCLASLRLFPVPGVGCHMELGLAWETAEGDAMAAGVRARPPARQVKKEG